SPSRSESFFFTRSSCSWDAPSAASKRAISAPTSSSAMWRFGVLTRRRSTMNAGPTASPGDAPTPRNRVGNPALPCPPVVELPSPALICVPDAPLVLSELVLHQLRQRLHRVLGVGSGAAHQDRRALGGHQHEHAHDALAVDALAVLLDGDGALILVGGLHELGGGTRVHAELVGNLQPLLHDVFAHRSLIWVRSPCGYGCS